MCNTVLYAYYVILFVKGLTVRFNPQVVVIDASGQNATLIRDFILTYSISSGDVLTNNGSLGTATIDETLTQNIVVCQIACISVMLHFVILGSLLFRLTLLNLHYFLPFVLLDMTLCLLMSHSREDWSVSVSKTTD